jgi:hypothetical protein
MSIAEIDAAGTALQQRFFGIAEGSADPLVVASQ